MKLSDLEIKLIDAIRNSSDIDVQDIIDAINKSWIWLEKQDRITRLSRLKGCMDSEFKDVVLANDI